MRKDDKKQIESQMLVRISRDLHMEVKALAAYRNQSMQDYVTTALLEQILKDKKYLNPKME